MSAIYGIINKNKQAVEQQAVNKIKQALAHRATDGERLLQVENVAFGFCKLAIYPQQQNEQLPIETADLVFTADARIDNRDELYSLLSLDKQQWQNEADSLLILKAYQHWGQKCEEHLQGEFVFAVWEKTSQQLFIAADQIGFRPVFYYNGPDAFIFCSEIKGIEAAKTTPNYFNEEHLLEYHFRQSNSDQTYNKDIFALCGGNTLSLRDDKLQVSKYWTLQNTGKYNFTKDEDWIACLRHLMYKAVEKRLNPDVPAGVSLSGGLDSSSVACILSDLLAKKNKPLYAFSSVLPLGHSGIERDERPFIEEVNKRCPNIIQTFVEAPGLGPLDNVADAFIKDESIPNGFFYIDQSILDAAQQKNIKTLFNGFGGDFWVSWKGTSVIYMMMQKGEYKKAFALFKDISKTNDINMLKLLRTDWFYYTNIWQRLRKMKPNRAVNWQEKTALQPWLVNKYMKQEPDLAPEPDQLIAMQDMLNSGRIARMIQMFANRNAWYGMSSCDVMFDKDIMEFLTDIPVHLLNYGGWRRGLIRYAMDGVLPPEVQWRKDKLPYNPDFARRSMNSKNKLYNIMNSSASKALFDTYFLRDTVEQNFDDIQPFAGFGSANSVKGIRIMQAGVSVEVLKYLKKIDYRL